jgi:predicted  nucleic acid-binding Zn-ribbon protein
MTTSDQSLRAGLKVLNKIVALDQRIARIIGERKRQIQTLKDRTVFYEEAKAAHEKASEAASVVRERYDQEEKALKEERERLRGRRKAVSSFSNYKVQQSALQELERAERLLSVREESLFSIVDNLDEVEDAEKAAAHHLADCEQAYQDIKSQSREGVSEIKEQFEEARKQRDELLEEVSAELRNAYLHVYERYPADAVVAVQNNHCSGCFMMVPPQVSVELYNCSSIVKCRGCGRILTLDKETHNEENEE